MKGVLVQWRRGSGEAEALDLDEGAELTFGRGEVDLVLDDPGVSRLAGRIRAAGDHWLISNLSRGSTYVVENPEGAGEFVKVPPRRLAMPVPFEFSRVVLPTRTSTVDFLVFAPSHLYADPDIPADQVGEATMLPFPLDVTAKYFLVLVALCEPRLRDAAAVAIPTVPEIIDRLSGLESCRDLSRSAVNFHIDYLAGTKLRVKEPGEGAKADWQRAALVSLVLRFNLVREEHLALLP